MAIIVGDFKSVAHAAKAKTGLESAGIPRNAINVTARGRVRLSVSADADHADRVLELVKAEGAVRAHKTTADWAEGTDQVSEERRFVTENRDTSREATEDRDDVEMVEEGVDRENARVYQGPQ